MKKISIIAFLIFPSIAHTQSAEPRTLDFANLRKCYEKIYHVTPKAQALPSVPTIRFVGDQKVGQSGRVTVNALVIQEPFDQKYQRTKVTVIQQRPLQEPGLTDKVLGKLFKKPFKQKGEFISQSVVRRNNLLRNQNCQTDNNHLQMAVARTCSKDAMECPNISLQIHSETKTVDGHRKPSLCVPKLVPSRKTAPQDSSIPEKQIEVLVKKALTSHFSYMAQNYNDIIVSTIGPLAGGYTSDKSSTSKNPAIIAYRDFTKGLQSVLRADHPIGACHKILIDPDPNLRTAMQSLFCQAAQGTDDSCSTPDGGNGSDGVKNGETL